MAKLALGKGLGALIQTKVATPTPIEEDGERVEGIPLGSIIPSPFQPRREFKEEALSELADSIRQHGIIQPLIVRKNGSQFELIAGERRWRAATKAGLAEAPVIVRRASDRDVLELALIENLQRADLNPIDEARAFERLSGEFSLRQEDIAQRVGRSRASVANSLRLLELHSQLQTWLTQNLLSVGHAKVLLGLKNPSEQLAAAEAVLRQGCNVRETEKLVQDFLRRNGTPLTPRNGGRSASGAGLSPAMQNVQNRLQGHLSTHVAIHHADKKGRIEIEYYGPDDLDRLLKVIGVPHE
ncbi:MAG TPA: ParB/RepB/Spo0J family partition protein [Chthoniobacterales bacterium]